MLVLVTYEIIVRQRMITGSVQTRGQRDVARTIPLGELLNKLLAGTTPENTATPEQVGGVQFVIIDIVMMVIEMFFVAFIDFPMRKLIETGKHSFGESRLQSILDNNEISLNEVVANLPLKLAVSRDFRIQKKLYRVNGALHAFFLHIVILLKQFTKTIKAR